MLSHIAWHLLYVLVALASGGAIGYFYGAKVRDKAVTLVNQAGSAARVEIKKVL